jgi:hypothetical protein
MNTETESHPTGNDRLNQAVRAYLAEIGRRGGRATKGSIALKLAATRNARATWAKRRIRYGPTGRRQPWQIKAAKMQAAAVRAE